MEHLSRAVESLVAHMRLCGLTLEEVESQVRKTFIEQELIECKGNKFKAATKMNLHRNTLNRRMAVLKLDGMKYRQKGCYTPAMVRVTR